LQDRKQYPSPFPQTPLAIRMLASLFRKAKLKRYLQQARQQGLPNVCCRYLEALQAFDAKQPLGNCRFVVFDTEATGLSPKKDRILSLGAVATRGNQIHPSDSFECLLAQQQKSPKATILVHGLLQADFSGALPEKEALLQWLEYLGDAVLVAHNLWFDQQILSQALKRHFGFPLLNQGLDTFHLAQRMDKGSKHISELPGAHYTLDSLCEQYGIKVDFRHSAAGDALATAELFLSLKAKAQIRGVGKVSEILG